MLNRDSIVNLLEMNGQNPCYLENSKTLIETKSAGVFYILEYNGTGRVGWGVYDSILQELKEYPKSAIILINSGDDEMFIILESNKDFYDSLIGQTSPYKIDRIQVKDYSISYENLDDYLGSL